MRIRLTTQGYLRCSRVAIITFVVIGIGLSGCTHQPTSSERPPRQAAIASAHPLATDAGFEVLDAGGNAFDAAVAVSAALAVVEPYSSGIGGGGFWLLHRAGDGKQVMVDGRERAPLAAHRDLYLDERGDVIPGASVNGPLAAGIPGGPAALDHIAANYGRLPLSRTLAPAIRLAKHGYRVDAHYQRVAGFRLEPLRASAAAAEIFLHNRDVPPIGHRIVQPQLATTLEQLAARGFDGFYRGPVAQQLVAGVRDAGGIWTLEDLDQYRVIERVPVYGHYRGYRVVSAAPPSSGGVALIEMLNMLSGYPQDRLNKADRTHYLVEVMRRAYRDRARYLGDPDFVDVPVRRLTNPEYALRLGADIQLDRATPSESKTPSRASGSDTTHFSIIDQEGNRVAATLSINYPFGSGFMPPGTGVLLNDEMDDFSVKPGVPNVYGLVGAEANAIAPGKRMLSSMSPTFVEGADRVAVLGTPGGSRIITMVLLGILEFVEGTSPQAWVERPRIHHQYLPDVVQIEPDAFTPDIQDRLRAKGHVLEVQVRPWGNMQAVMWNRRTGEVSAASDPRGVGQARVR